MLDSVTLFGPYNGILRQLGPDFRAFFVLAIATAKDSLSPEEVFAERNALFSSLIGAPTRADTGRAGGIDGAARFATGAGRHGDFENI